MARKIVVTSGKGGVGKTTVVTNLGVQLSLRGRRVIVCDLDMGLNNADVVLGVENASRYDLVDAVEGRCRPVQTLVPHPEHPTLFVLPSNKTGDRYVSPQSVRLILDSLAPRFDYLLIDCPAGIEEGFHRAVACADEALVVTTPHVSAVRDAGRVVEVLLRYRLKRAELIVNRVRKDVIKRGDGISPEEISELLRLPLVGTIPETDKILQKNIVERERSFKTLAKRIDGV